MATNNYLNSYPNGVKPVATYAPTQQQVPTFPTYQPPQQTFTPPTQNYFPQPQGNVYMLNNASEISNIPITSGISAAISLADGVLFLKTTQNGAPAVFEYKFHTSADTKEEQITPVKNVESILQSYEKRISELEKLLQPKKEENLQWQV